MAMKTKKWIESALNFKIYFIDILVAKIFQRIYISFVSPSFRNFKILWSSVQDKLLSVVAFSL